jgi:hypothetical protein
VRIRADLLEAPARLAIGGVACRSRFVCGANRHDSQEALALVEAIPPLHGDSARPRQRPDCVLGDRGYDATANRRSPDPSHRALLGVDQLAIVAEVLVRA